MIVKDDGVGLPDGFDPAKSSSMGLQIVDALVRQMKGRIRFESTPAKASPPS
jgi:two-component sensor histidine kinase